MNNFFTKTALIIATIVLFGSFLTVSAQTLAPNTAGVNLFCSDGELTLPAATAGTDWIVKYSATSTTTPATGITLAGGNKVANADLKPVTTTSVQNLPHQAPANRKCRKFRFMY